jgi:hypothetical protein
VSLFSQVTEGGHGRGLHCPPSSNSLVKFSTTDSSDTWRLIATTLLVSTGCSNATSSAKPPESSPPVARSGNSGANQKLLKGKDSVGRDSPILANRREFSRTSCPAGTACYQTLELW